MSELNKILEKDELYEKLTETDDNKAIQNILCDYGICSDCEELDENALEAVSGGYSRSWESTKIVAVTYYEIKKYGRAKTYNKYEISEAISWVERNSKIAKKSLKTAIEEIKVGIGLAKGLGLI